MQQNMQHQMLTQHLASALQVHLAGLQMVAGWLLVWWALGWQTWVWQALPIGLLLTPWAQGQHWACSGPVSHVGR